NWKPGLACITMSCVISPIVSSTKLEPHFSANKTVRSGSKIQFKRSNTESSAKDISSAIKYDPSCIDCINDRQPIQTFYLTTHLYTLCRHGLRPPKKSAPSVCI
ncbi:hypothetical protein DOY81_010475, partial [Sarcophaga bullata]